MNCYSILTPTRLGHILTRVAHRITILQSQLVTLTTSTDTINVERILKLPVPYGAASAPQALPQRASRLYQGITSLRMTFAHGVSRKPIVARGI